MARVNDADKNSEALKELLSSFACNGVTTLKVGPMSIPMVMDRRSIIIVYTLVDTNDVIIHSKVP